MLLHSHIVTTDPDQWLEQDSAPPAQADSTRARMRCCKGWQVDGDERRYLAALDHKRPSRRDGG